MDDHEDDQGNREEYRDEQQQSLDDEGEHPGTLFDRWTPGSLLFHIDIKHHMALEPTANFVRKDELGVVVGEVRNRLINRRKGKLRQDVLVVRPEIRHTL